MGKWNRTFRSFKYIWTTTSTRVFFYVSLKMQYFITLEFLDNLKLFLSTNQSSVIHHTGPGCCGNSLIWLNGNGIHLGCLWEISFEWRYWIFSISNYFEKCFFCLFFFSWDKMVCLFRVGCQAGFICFFRFVRRCKLKQVCWSSRFVFL